jgi:hypothetical protein
MVFVIDQNQFSAHPYPPVGQPAQPFSPKSSELGMHPIVFNP